MGKRKGSESACIDESSVKKIKQLADGPQKESLTENGSTGGTFMDLSTPSAVMNGLIYPTQTEEFFTKYWEKEPLHLKRNDADYYGKAFTLNMFKDILGEQALNFEFDVNVCRYVDGEKELLNEDGQITVEKAEKLMKEKKATFQFHQPQRYADLLWNMLEKLESNFGSLVGSNVYITPADSQGLAPHCDDVEIFVMQMEGKKNWKVYKPQVELSRDYTQDLPQDSLGPPIMDITLEVGDLLYLPRGFIHQAKTVGDHHSTHLTLSTYQANTWGDFMQHAVTQAIENALEDDKTFREGLPVNNVSFLGTGKNLSKYLSQEDEVSKLSCNEKEQKVVAFKEKIKKQLSLLVDHIDVNTASDAMNADFIANRLPPYGYLNRYQITTQLENGEKKNSEESTKEEKEEHFDTPTLEDSIKIRFPDHTYLVYVEEDDEINLTQLEDDEDSDDEMEEDDEESEEEEKKKPKVQKKRSQSEEKPAAKAAKMKHPSENEDDDDEDFDHTKEEPCLKVINSLSNDRGMHMLGERNPTPVGVKLALHYSKAAQMILNSKDFIKVKDLPLTEDDDKITIATVLFAEDLVLKQAPV